jgi:hypothetical protein
MMHRVNLRNMPINSVQLPENARLVSPLSVGPIHSRLSIPSLVSPIGLAHMHQSTSSISPASYPTFYPAKMSVDGQVAGNSLDLLTAVSPHSAVSVKGGILKNFSTRATSK